jgi:hypothetical protein
MVRQAASVIASASVAAFFYLLTKSFTQIGAIVTILSFVS